MESGENAPDAEWDEWDPAPEEEPIAASGEVEEEPPVEEDPFADMGMAPVVAKTKRHTAVRCHIVSAPTQS